MIDRINVTRLFIQSRFRLSLNLGIYLLLAAIAAGGLSFGGARATGFPPMKAAVDSQLTVVSAASYSDEALAPGSIAAVFGDNLSTSAMTGADVDPDTPGVQLPTTLGGTTVRVDGIPAQLLFVSK